MEKALRDVWASYERFRSKGEAYSAITQLAGLENVVFFGTLEVSVRDRWRSRVVNEKLSPAEMEVALTSAKVTVERLKRILGVGGRFEYEELMLLLTLRIEVDLVNELLVRRTGVAAAETVTIDEDLVDLMQSTNHSSAFANAQAAARRNWGIPIATRWLSSVVQN